MTKGKTSKPAEEKVDNGERGALDTSKVVGSATAEPETEAKPAKTEKNSTTFEFKNGGSRTFSQSVHGKGWEDLADEFQATNIKVLASRDGEAL